MQNNGSGGGNISYIDALARGLAQKKERDNIAQEWTSDLSADIDYMIPFPCLARDLQDWILDTSVKPQPAFAFAAALVVLSVIQGRSVGVDGIKGNLMFLGLAGSGEGKDHPLKIVRVILEAVGVMDAVHGQMASGAALFEAVYESPAMALILDEAGHYFSGVTGKGSNQYSREIMPMITEIATSAGDCYIEKKRKGQDVRRVNEPCLSILGMSTEKQIMDALRTSEVADGSLARFMVIFGRNNVMIRRKKKSSKDVPDYIKSRLEMLKRPFLLSSQNISTTPEYQAEMDRILESFCQRGMDTGKKGGDKALFGPLWHRCGVRSIQMACLLDSCHSIDILRWCEETVTQTTELLIKKFLHLAADNDNERFVKLVERVIKEAGVNGVTKKQFYDATRAVEAGMKKRIITELLEADKIFAEERTVFGSRKKSTVYFWRK